MVGEIELSPDSRKDAGEEVVSGTCTLVVDTPTGLQTLTLIRIH